MKKRLLIMGFLLMITSQQAGAHSIKDVTTDPFYYDNPYQNSPVGITLDGLPLHLGEVQAMKGQHSIMVPVRAVAESLGADVQWYGSNRIAIVSNGKTTIRFYADSHNANVNDRPTPLPEKPWIKQGRMLVPMVILKKLVMDEEYTMVYSNQEDLIKIESKVIPPDTINETYESSGVQTSETEKMPETEKAVPEPASQQEPKKVVIPSLDSLISNQ